MDTGATSEGQSPASPRRLRALHGYEVLDTERERDFDDIANLAAAICGTPIALVSLIDAERQWFKAETGMGLRETPLSQSICAQIVQDADFAEITDTAEDPRTRDNPLCCGAEGVRFYAGAVLRSDDGLPLGTLCVLDFKPGALTPLQRDTLRVLARQVMAQLEMRKALRIAETLKQEVDHRVKNSLQSLSSFVRLQQRAFSAPIVDAAMSNLASRIDALTRLHEQLYRTDERASLDLGVYVEGLCHGVARLAPPGVTVTSEADHVVVDAQQAVAVGTFLNEAAANAFKHAFPGGRHGEVRVRVAADPGGEVTVVCADDGVGPEGGADRGDIAATDDSVAGGRLGSGLGSQIADVIRLELGATLDVRGTAQGTTARLTFQLDRRG